MFWLRGRHPPEPPSFRTTVRAARRRAALWARGKLKRADGEAVFEDLWSGYKRLFSRRQQGKCGYCELSIAADPRGGDIEHYRPKALICELLDDPGTWGDEVHGHNSRDPERPRAAPPVCRGYWWLAYDWRNYLLSCGTCNQKWKGNLFPVEGGRSGAPTPESCACERALLLNPYGDVDPAEHLEFDEIGLVTPHDDSPLGRETIRTCHLGRETLRYQRAQIARLACSFIADLVRELCRDRENVRRRRKAAVRLFNLGLPGKPHAGMVRILWMRRNPFGFAWEELRALARHPRAKGSPRSS